MILVIGYEGTAKLDHAQKLVDEFKYPVELINAERKSKTYEEYMASIDADIAAVDNMRQNRKCVLVSKYVGHEQLYVNKCVKEGKVTHVHIVHQELKSVVANVIDNFINFPEKETSKQRAKTLIDVVKNYNDVRYEIACFVEDVTTDKISCTQVHV